MKWRYRQLEDEFLTYDLVELCGVSQRNAEKMVERWKAEGYIRMKEYMVYEKIIPELL
jgi:Mn-dependent DtxR family transcriptional regulator